MKVINLINTEEIRAEWIALNDAAELTNVSVRTLRQAVNHRRVSNMFYVRPLDVNRWIKDEQNTAGQG